jgi:hypothetical protein
MLLAVAGVAANSSRNARTCLGARPRTSRSPRHRRCGSDDVSTRASFHRSAPATRDLRRQSPSRGRRPTRGRAPQSCSIFAAAADTPSYELRPKHIKAFEAHLEKTCPKLARQRFLSVCNAWDDAVHGFDAWPRLRIQCKKRRLWYTRPMSEYPASLNAEIADMLEERRSGDLRVTQWRAPLRPGGERNVRDILRRYMHHLCETGVSPHSLASLEAAITSDNANRALDHAAIGLALHQLSASIGLPRSEGLEFVGSRSATIGHGPSSAARGRANDQRCTTSILLRRVLAHSLVMSRSTYGGQAAISTPMAMMTTHHMMVGPNSPWHCDLDVSRGSISIPLTLASRWSWLSVQSMRHWRERPRSSCSPKLGAN